MIFSQKQYQIKQTDRQLSDYIPPVSVLLGGIIFLVGTISAIFLYETPNGKYQFLDQFFSELGIRNNYVDDNSIQKYAPSNPDLFNMTLYASGFLMIPFFMFTFRQMRNDNRFSNLSLIIATTSGVLAGPSMIGVGIFDLSFSASQIYQEHFFYVVPLYVFITITSILWMIMLTFSSNLPYRKTKWIVLDYIFLITLTIFTILNLTDSSDLLKVEDIPLLNAYPIEAYQKLIAYLFFMYYGLVVGFRLTKTKYDNTPVLGTEVSDFVTGKTPTFQSNE